MKNSTSIDYLTIRFSYTSPFEVLTFSLGLDFTLFVVSAGRYGYKESLRYDNIAIYYGAREEMGVCVEMTGQGCREYCALLHDDYALLKLIMSLSEDDAITRIDFAFDDVEGILSFETIMGKNTNGEINTKLKKREEILVDGGYGGHTLYFGSRTSDYRIRIYDKAVESQASYPWLRVEEILRHEESDGFIKRFQKENDGSASSEKQLEKLYSMASGLLFEKLKFIEPTDSNISRCKVCSWWQSFLENATCVNGMKKPRAALEADRVMRWIRKFVSQSLAALCLTVGPDWLFDTIEYGIKQNLREARSHNSRYEKIASSLMSMELSPKIDLTEKSFIDFLHMLEKALHKSMEAAEKECRDE